MVVLEYPILMIAIFKFISAFLLLCLASGVFFYVILDLKPWRKDSKILDKAQEELSLIAGQKAVKTKAKKAIAGFKIRAGMPLGVSVTLRNKIMYEFLDRLINIAIPRIRDFRGLNSKSFDGNGNYSLGIKEQIIFPEINYDKIDKVRGLDITICTSTKNNNEALELLKNFNMPFKDKEIN